MIYENKQITIKGIILLFFYYYYLVMKKKTENGDTFSIVI